MNINIQNIGAALVVQSVARYAACIFIAWLTLTIVDGWVMAYLDTLATASRNGDSQ